MIYNSFVFTGHGTSEVTGAYDPGATSGKNVEHDIAKQIVQASKKYLDTLSLNIHYDENNFSDNDLANNTYTAKSGLSVHINAGGGTGVEVYVPLKELYLDADFTICSDISKLLGIPNRGVKSRVYDTGNTYIRVNGVMSSGKDYYKEIRDAWNNGISLSILEVGFIDTGDIDKIKAHIDELGYYVAKYIALNCNQLLPKIAVNTVYRVKVDGAQIGAYSKIDNILAEVERCLKDKRGKIEIVKK